MHAQGKSDMLTVSVGNGILVYRLPLASVARERRTKENRNSLMASVELTLLWQMFDIKHLLEQEFRRVCPIIPKFDLTFAVTDILVSHEVGISDDPTPLFVPICDISTRRFVAGLHDDACGYNTKLG